jgi:hypothetical protein
MNVWIRKLMRRKGSVKEGYDGRSLTGRGDYFGRRKNYWKGEKTVCLRGLFSSVGSLFYGFLVNQKQGAPVCWGFWAQGPG